MTITIYVRPVVLGGGNPFFAGAWPKLLLVGAIGLGGCGALEVCAGLGAQARVCSAGASVCGGPVG